MYARTDSRTCDPACLQTDGLMVHDKAHYLAATAFGVIFERSCENQRFSVKSKEGEIDLWKQNVLQTLLRIKKREIIPKALFGILIV